jgi:hypothetical protein
MTKHTYIAALGVTAALGAAVATVFALAGRGTFEHRILATAFALAGALLLLLASVLHWIARRASRRWLRSIACGTALLGVVSLSQIESRMIGAIVHNRDVRAARAFSEHVVERLEELHKTSGRYPPALEDALRELPVPPYLFQRGSLFTSSGDDFVLSFSEADAVVPHIVQYSSASSRWERF